MFKDILTAYHYGIQTCEDGSVEQGKDAIPFIKDLSCQVSFEEDDTGVPGDAHYERQRHLKVFVCGCNHGFKCGDWVCVKRDQVVYEGNIGEPRLYTNLIPHVELSLEAWKGGLGCE